MPNWTEASLSDRTPQPLAQRSPRLEKKLVFSPVIPQLRFFTHSALPHQREKWPISTTVVWNHNSLAAPYVNSRIRAFYFVAFVPSRCYRWCLCFTVGWRRFTATASEMGWIWVCVQRIRRRMRLDRFRELGRQYPVFCFLLLVLLLATVLLNRFSRHTHTHTCAHREFSVKMFDSILVYLQIYPHHNGVLVLPGWSGHFLLFSGSRISASKRLYLHQTKDKGR